MALRQRPSVPPSERPQNRRAPKPVPTLSAGQRVALGLAWLRSQSAILRRVFGLAGRLALAGAVAAVLWVAVRAAERYVYSSPSFALRDIAVIGNHMLSRDAVIEAAGLKLGQNVFQIGPEQVKQRLLQVPWIETASVRRTLPASYVIELRERRALALLAVPELHLVGDDGVVFKPLSAGDPYDLPVITGIDAAQIGADRRGAASALVSAVALLHDYQDAGLWRREPLAEIHIEADGGLSLYVGTDTTRVQLGKPPFRQKLERLREVMALLTSQKTRAAYVLLDNQRRLDRVTVRLR
jgi:cell division protein FtsQ